MTNREVIRTFVKGRGQVSHLALHRNLHIDDGYLYSYAMKIAFWNREGICVVNGDPVTMPTAGHLSTLQEELKSFCALEEFVTIPSNTAPAPPEELSILYIEPEGWLSIHQEDNTRKRVYWYGGAVFSWRPHSQGKRRYYLQSLYSEKCLLTELPKKPCSYQHGLELLGLEGLKGFEKGERT